MCAIVGLGSPSYAFAQVGHPWLEGSAPRGIGIRTDNLEFHPGLAGEVGYDSNYFQASGDDGEPTIPTLRMRLTPSLSLQTLSAARSEGDGPQAAPPKVKFRTDASLSVDKLISLLEQYSARLEGQTQIGGSVQAKLNVSPDRPLGADFFAGFSRIAQPFNSPGVLSFNRKVYHGGADLRWRPGGGLLEWNLGYGARATAYEQTDFGLNNVVHGANTRGLWRFLPKTGLIYQGEVQFVKRLYQPTRLHDGTSVSSQLGINGLITSKIGALVLGGWRSGFYEADEAGNVEDLDTPIGRAELTWFIAGNAELASEDGERGFSTLKIGYYRDGYPSELANYYIVDRGYLELSMLVGASVFVAAGGGASNVQHAMPREADGTPLRPKAPREFRPEAYLFAEWRLASTFAVFLNSAYSASPRNNVLSNGMGGTDSMKFSRFTAMLGARWFM